MSLAPCSHVEICWAINGNCLVLEDIQQNDKSSTWFAIEEIWQYDKIPSTSEVISEPEIARLASLIIEFKFI